MQKACTSDITWLQPKRRQEITLSNERLQGQPKTKAKRPRRKTKKTINLSLEKMSGNSLPC